MDDNTAVVGWRRFVSMEPLAFALLFAYSVSESVTADLIIYQTCKTIPSINISECEILHIKSHSEEAKRIERLVQPHTSNIFMIQSCIDTIFPTIISFFLGPWSDKNGRKPVLIIPLIGQVIYFTIYAILSNFNLNPFWYVIPSIPTALLGGFTPLLMMFFCYITDITDNQTRAWHLACLETSLFAGIFAGLLVGPIVFKEYGYTEVFLLSGFTCLFALLYTIFIVKETIQNQNGISFLSIFDFSLVKESFRTITKKRDGFDKYLVWCCIAAISLHAVIFEGNKTIAFLFTSAKLGWNISDFSIYSGTNLFISIIGMLLVIKFVGSVLKLPETVIIILSSVSISIGCFAKAFVLKPWHMYLSSSFGLFGASTVPVIRAVMSKSVPQKDIGKVFSVATTIEFLVPFATTPLYLQVYSHTLQLYPSPVWFISAAIPWIVIVLIIIINKRSNILINTQYSPVMEDNQTQE